MSMKYTIIGTIFAALFFGAGAVCAQGVGGTSSEMFADAVSVIAESGTTSTTSDASLEMSLADRAASSTPVLGNVQLEKKDVTVPEQPAEKEEILKLLEKRPVLEPSVLRFIPYWVQESIRLGIPANTIILILLVPVLATIVAFMRLVIGLPSLEMLVPIILSFTFVALGIAPGLIVLFAVIAASFFSRLILKRVSIMHLPKRSLSLFFLSFFVFAALTVSVAFDIGDARTISIFPVLILILLGDKVVSVQLHKSMQETILITSVTILLGVLGYLLAVFTPVRNLIVLYPEVVLLVVPLDIMLGRYFGMRLTEYFRFNALRSYGGE